MNGYNIDQPAVMVALGVLVAVGVALNVVETIRNQRRLARWRRHQTVVAADEAALPVRQPGQELEVEFTAGPTGFGLWFHDDLLAQVVTTWQRELEGGSR